MLKPLTWELYDDAPLRWRQLRGLVSWLDYLSEEVEIEKNKSSVIVRKPCQTLELLGLQWCLGRRTSWIFEYWWMENKGSCKFVPVKLKLSCGAKLPRISWLSITNTKPETPIFVSLLLLNVLDLKTCYLDCKPNKNLFVGNCWPCLWPGSDHARYICNKYGFGPCSCPDEMTSLPTARTAATPGTRWRRSGTQPAKPDVQMTRSSSVGGGVFRGTCGYPLCKEDRTALICS